MPESAVLRLQMLQPSLSIDQLDRSHSLANGVQCYCLTTYGECSRDTAACVNNYFRSVTVHTGLLASVPIAFFYVCLPPIEVMESF